MSGLTNRPKVLKGAFVEYGLTFPPLFVLFQFNPVQLQRSRSLTFAAPNEAILRRIPGKAGAGSESLVADQRRDLREWHGQFDDLGTIRKNQIVTVDEEKLSFDLRLDATDALETGNPIAVGYGIGPALSTLELMTYPKGEGALADAVALLGPDAGFRYTSRENPPIVLFIWGIQRVLPVNINSLTITETEFDPLLNPVRASVAVSLTVIEGNNPVFMFSKTTKQVMSALNVANVVTDIVIPG